MPARLPIQAKSPFHLDRRPLAEMSSPHAGLLGASRALRSLRLPALVEANLKLKSRSSGFSEAQAVESIVLLHLAGGDCPEDFSLFHGDQCLERGLGYVLPKARTVRDFLDRFHDEAIALTRPPRAQQKSFLLPASQPVQALQQVQAGFVQNIAKGYTKAGETLTIATID